MTRGEGERGHGTGTSTFWDQTKNDKTLKWTECGLDLITTCVFVALLDIDSLLNEVNTVGNQ